LEQLFQPLSVAMMFGMQAIDFFAQRGHLCFIHQAPPSIKEHLHISPLERKRQAEKQSKVTSRCGIRRGKLPCVTAITTDPLAVTASEFDRLGEAETQGP
jgi:hypothetical protein